LGKFFELEKSWKGMPLNFSGAKKQKTNEESEFNIKLSKKKSFLLPNFGEIAFPGHLAALAPIRTKSKSNSWKTSQ
jgi:hypothetical protein